jgi:hypothetical protein
VIGIAPVRTASITARVSTADRMPVERVTVEAWLPMLYRRGSSSKPVIVREDGTYVFGDLVPGEYTVMARAPNGADAIFAVARVPVDGTDVDVPLELRRGATLRGRIVFDDTGNVPAAAILGTRSRRVSLVPAASAYEIRQRISGDWSFEMAPIVGSQLVRPILPPNWTLTSVRLGAVDITDTPIDFDRGDVGPVVVHVTRTPIVTAGIVVDALRRPDDDATIVIFSTDRRKWGPETRYVVALHSDANGRFDQRGLPAGEYLAVAVRDLEAGEETNPETLERLRPRGVPVTLADGQTRSLTLTSSSAD